MRKGFSLIAALIASVIVAGIVSGTVYLSTKKSRVFVDTVWAEKALNAAKSGVFYALAKIKSGELESGTVKDSLSDGSRFSVSVSKVDDKTYKIESVGEYKDALKRIVVGVKKEGGGKFIPFVVGEKLELEKLQGFHSHWTDAEIWANKISEDDKETLEKEGFEFVKEKVSMPNTHIVEENGAIEPVVPSIDIPDSCDLVLTKEDSENFDLKAIVDTYCSSNGSCGTKDDPFVVCADKSSDLKIKAGFINLDQEFSDFNLIIVSNKAIKSKGYFRINFEKPINGDFNLAFLAKGGDLDIKSTFEIRNLNATGSVHLTLYSKKSIRMKRFRLGNLVFGKIVSGNGTFVTFYSKESSTLDELDFTRITSKQNIKFIFSADKGLDLGGVDFDHLEANNGDIEVVFSSQEKGLKAKKGFDFSSITCNRLFTKFILNESIEFQPSSSGIDFFALNLNELFLLLKAKEIVFESAEAINLDDAKKKITVMLLTDESIKHNGYGGDLVGFNGDIKNAELNMFFVAGKSIKRQKNSFTFDLNGAIKKVNAILWAGESVDANTVINGDSSLNLSILTKRLNWKAMFNGISTSGLSLEEMQELCLSDLPEEFKKVPCSLVKTGSGGGPETYKLTGWQIY